MTESIVQPVVASNPMKRVLAIRDFLLALDWAKHIIARRSIPFYCHVVAGIENDRRSAGARHCSGSGWDSARCLYFDRRRNHGSDFTAPGDVDFRCHSTFHFGFAGGAGVDRHSADLDDLCL